MIHLSIVTPVHIAFDDQVYSISVPGYMGYMQVLPNHAAIITSLCAGKVTILSKESKEVAYIIDGGFFEFSNNHATLLADSIQNQ